MMTLTDKMVHKLTEELQLLRDSCLNALDGSWDIHAPEWQEGFESMANGVEALAKLLGLTLDDYDPNWNGDYDEEEEQDDEE